jgi:type IV secretion system protein VirD4
VLLVAACASLFCGVIALAGLGRLGPHVDPIRAIAWFWWFRADPLVRRWLAIGALASLGLVALVGLSITRTLRPPLHGRARWAGERELAREQLRASKGIILGRKAGRLLVFGGPEHVLLYAPTRTGKGVGVVIPNLLNWPDSAVVLDIKRENFEASAGFRAAHGQEVLLFDPLEPEGRTARYNPLGHIDRTDPIAVMDELQKLAVMLFPTRENTDPFWAEAARTGLIGVGAYVAETPELSFSLGSIFAELTRGEPKSRLSALMAARADAGRPLSAPCAEAITDFCSASENTFASIKQTITARMNLWLNPRVRAATEVSDFDLRDLRTRPISLYLCVSPDNLARIAPLYNLLLQQLIDLNTRERPSPDRHPIEVLVLLDEFARLGHAQVIASAFAYVAGYGLRLVCVLQSPAQLRAEYGPHVAEEIITNCGVEVVFAPKDVRLAQALSERLGFYTYEGRSISRPIGLSGGRRSMNQSDQRRALMMPQELIQLGPDQLIVLRAGIAPLLGTKIVYWRERAFRRRVMPAPSLPRRAPAASNPSQAAPPVAPNPGRRQAEGAGDPQPAIEAAAAAAAAMGARGIRPLAPDASPEEVEAWSLTVVDAMARPPARLNRNTVHKAQEEVHGR